jgi:hypothetical protein
MRHEVYEGNGVRFRYPIDWTVGEQSQGQESTITVESGETAFWSITVFRDAPELERIVESAVDAFREEYDDLDVYPVDARVCSTDAVARNLEFFCLELTNSAFLRAFHTDRVTALVLYQATDHELPDCRETLEAITASLECGADDVELF